MALTVTQVKNARPGDSPYKLHDAGGLFLLVTKSGTKSWRQKYRFGGKEKQLTHGQYPMISLAEARELRDQAKRELAQGLDPSAKAREIRARRAGTLAGGTTFRQAARL